MAEQRGEVLPGTLDLIVLKTLDTLGPLHGYGMAVRIQQVSADLLRLTGHSLPRFVAARTARMDLFQMGRFGPPPQGEVLFDYAPREETTS